MNRSLAILLVVIIGCGSLELLQARTAPLLSADKTHKRWVRRRVARYDPDLEIVEVKDVYYVRRPKKVVTNPISEDEMDKRVRCDFEPQRSECQDLRPTTTTTTTTTEDSLDRRIRCDFDPTAADCQAAATTQRTPRSTTRATTTTSSTTIGTTASTSTSSSTSSTTTDLPLLPELTEPEEVTEEVPEEVPEEKQTTTEADFMLPEEDEEDPDASKNTDAYEDGTDGDVDEEDDYDTDVDETTGSIGNNDITSEWNIR